jgi:hypothetical protein
MHLYVYLQCRRKRLQLHLCAPLQPQDAFEIRLHLRFSWFILINVHNERLVFARVPLDLQQTCMCIAAAASNKIACSSSAVWQVPHVNAAWMQRLLDRCRPVNMNTGVSLRTKLQTPWTKHSAGCCTSAAAFRRSTVCAVSVSQLSTSSGRLCSRHWCASARYMQLPSACTRKGSEIDIWHIFTRF